jgi:hypothetical protein
MVSNPSSVMETNIQFRFMLPVLQFVAATFFGGIGLWQRHQILNQPFMGDQTLWETTARFHVWPLPYRFAVISNIPAVLAAAVIEWPIGTIWPDLGELFGFVLFLLFVPILWFFVGLQLDRHPSAYRRYSWLLIYFALFCAITIFTPGYVGYVISGSVLWLAFVVLVVRIGAKSRLRIGSPKKEAES